MTYQECLQYLFEKHAAYFQKGASAYSGKLEAIQNFCDTLENPQNNYPVIHIAGTNGKGSTASIIASICKEHGLKTGLYTSPHLYDFRERIRINGETIPQSTVVELTQQFKKKNNHLTLSFFEITTAMAFVYFKNEKVDIAILETGLGGRLDATNIAKNKIAAVITPIGKDHIQILGNTLEEIANEKAGIIPNSKICLTATSNYKQPSILKRIKEKAKNENSKWIEVSKNYTLYTSDLTAHYQQENIHLAYLTCLNAFEYIGKNWEKEKALKALQNVKKNSGLVGRFEKVLDNPTIIFDVAHNLEGVTALISSLPQPVEGIHFIYAGSHDKDTPSILTSLPLKNNKLYLTAMPNERSLTELQLNDLNDKLQLNASVHSAPQQALNTAIKSVKNNETLLIFGSFFIFEHIVLPSNL